MNEHNAETESHHGHAIDSPECWDKCGDPTETDRDWHGWSRGGVALHIGPLPDRKSVCLYTHVGCTIEPVAYFRSVDDAQRALNVLDHLLSR